MLGSCEGYVVGYRAISPGLFGQERVVPFSSTGQVPEKRMLTCI